MRSRVSARTVFCSWSVRNLRCINALVLTVEQSTGVLKSESMPQFVIERDIVGAGSLTEEQIREVSLRSLETLKEMGSNIQWLHSYVTEDKVYCVYLAPDEETIREHARKSGIRADRVSAVRRLINPAAFN